MKYKRPNFEKKLKLFSDLRATVDTGKKISTLRRAELGRFQLQVLNNYQICFVSTVFYHQKW